MTVKASCIIGMKLSNKRIMYFTNNLYSIPAEWIEGDTHPNGIPYNSVLSEFDKILIGQLYGSPSSAKAGDAGDM